MDKYLVGTKFNIPMESDEVPAGSLVSVDYEILRMSPEDVPGDFTVSGTFTAIANPNGEITLPVTGVGIRSVWKISYIYTDLTSNQTSYETEIIVEGSETLVKGVNSFMDYREAVLMAEEISGVDLFKSTSKEDQIRNIISAYDVLKTMVFADNTGDHYDIGNYNAERLDNLEPQFLRALKIASIIEANEMLDVNSLHYKRLDGLMSETIGESSMMFRPGNVQNFPITRRSLTYLRNYIVIRARLGRA